MREFKQYPEKISPLFVVLSAIFITCLLLSNIIAGKLTVIFGLVLPAAIIIFPVTYIFGDVLTEVYGFKRSRLIIWLGVGCNLLMVLIFWAALKLPPLSNDAQTAYVRVLGMVPRVVLFSILGYWSGELLNSIVLSVLKKVTKGKWLYIRTIGSTIVGEGVDTIVFIVGAFYGTPNLNLGQMILYQYLFKVLYETAATPLTYWVVRVIKRSEGLDTFDYGVKYNPFGLEIEK